MSMLFSSVPCLVLRSLAGMWPAALNAARGVHFKRAHVTAYVQYPSNNRADPTNAAPSAKPIIDGFTKAGLWADDDSKHVIGPDFRREAEQTGIKGLHRIRFIIQEES